MSSSMNETTALIAESHKLVESGNGNDSKMLQLILKIVTNTDKRIERMEQKMNEQIGEFRKSITSVSSRVFEIEKQVTNMKRKIPELENNLLGSS